MKDFKIFGFQIIKYENSRSFKVRCDRCSSTYQFSKRGKHECIKCAQDDKVRHILENSHCDLILISDGYYTFTCKACHTEFTKTHKQIMRYYKYHNSKYDCAQCFNEKRKIEAYILVKDKVEMLGGKLLSTPYNKKFKIQCGKCGQIKETYHFNSVCNSCFKKSKKRLQYIDVKTQLEKLGWTILFNQQEFDNCDNIDKVKFDIGCRLCNKPHSAQITKILNRKNDKCPSCSYAYMGNNKTNTYDKVNTTIAQKGYTLLTKENEYINCTYPLDIQCPKGHKFSYYFHQFNIMDIPCRKCNYKTKRFTSKKETEVVDYVKSLGVICEQSNRSLLSGNYEIDIYVPSKKLAIEFNGVIQRSLREMPKIATLKKQ